MRQQSHRSAMSALRTAREKLLTACSECRMLRYCSTLCRVKDAGAYEIECRGLRACLKAQRAALNHIIEPGRYERALVRVCAQRKRLGNEWWGPIEALLVHRDDLGSNEGILKTAAHLLRMAGEQVQDLKELNAIQSRLSSSSFVANAHNQEGVYGKLMQSTAALINHSCLQNTLLVIPNGYGVEKAVHIVALKEIKPGEELTISYSTVHEPFHLRQLDQQEHWFFNCRCPLCLKSEINQCSCSSCKETKARKDTESSKSTKIWIDPREAFFCGRLDCNGWLLKCKPSGKPVGLCSKCKCAVSYDVEQIPKILQSSRELLQKAQEITVPGESSSPLGVIYFSLNPYTDEKADAFLSSAAPIMKKLTLIQPPCAYPCFELLRTISTILRFKSKYMQHTGRDTETGYIDEEVLRFAYLEMAAWNAGGRYCIMPYGHSYRAVTTAMISKIQMLRPQIVRKDGVTGRLTERPSDYLTRVPVLPRGEYRQKTALQLMKQALGEGKIAYGKEGDSVFVKELTKEVAHYEGIMDELLDLTYRNRPGKIDTKGIDLRCSGMTM